jgi:phospholipid-binding lipoprotein MlaA
MKAPKLNLYFLLFFVAFILCSSNSITWAQDYDDEYLDENTASISDPYESFNRKMFNFNDAMFNKVVEPLSKGYDFLVPKKIQEHIGKLFLNARMPVRFFNCIFQGKYRSASSEMGRFLINSTIGLGGIFDPADAHFYIESTNEDFGQTLGYHGADTGPYIVLPFLGPSSRRNIIGLIGDIALDPLTWLAIMDVEPQGAIWGARVLDKTNKFSSSIRDQYIDIRKGALDPYIAVQDAFVKNREKLINE